MNTSLFLASCKTDEKHAIYLNSLINGSQQYSTDISGLLNSTWLHGCLAASQEADEHENSTKFRNFVKKQFSIEKNVVFVKVPGSACIIRRDESIINEPEAAVMLQIVRALVHYGFDGKDIIVTSPFPGQRNLARNGIDMLQSFFPGASFSGVRSFLFDTVGDLESSIAIMNLMITDSDALLNSAGRLLAGAARAKHGLIIIGSLSDHDIEVLSHIRTPPTTLVPRLALLNHCVKSNIVYTWPTENIPEYIAPAIPSLLCQVCTREGYSGPECIACHNIFCEYHTNLEQRHSLNAPVTVRHSLPQCFNCSSGTHATPDCPIPKSLADREEYTLHERVRIELLRRDMREAAERVPVHDYSCNEIEEMVRRCRFD